jgi:hypothetical protein
VAEAGLEHPADYSGKAGLSTESDAKSDALAADPPSSTNAELVHLVAMWAKLPESLRASLFSPMDTSTSIP